MQLAYIVPNRYTHTRINRRDNSDPVLVFVSHKRHEFFKVFAGKYSR